MSSWNERTKTRWDKRIIRVLMIIIIFLVALLVVCGKAKGAPESFFAALMPGESVRYSYQDSIGRVQFTRDNGSSWLVGWSDGQGYSAYYLLGADEALVETIARPRIARTEGSGLLYVSSIMDKDVIYQIYLPKVRNP